MIDIRCVKCNRLLMRVSDNYGTDIEVKCPKCAYINNFHPKEEPEIPGDMKQVNVVYK